MKPRSLLVVSALLAISLGAGWAYLRTASVGVNMSTAADAFVASLSEQQRSKVVFSDYDAPERLGWHFIPKDSRKGLQIKEMDKQQRSAAHALLRSTLSEVGYGKAVKIMQLEHVLHMLEAERGSNRNIRDTERYYFTVFGKPSDQGRWGLSIEGHHLSLNFVVEDGNVVSSTPTFFAANPATVKNEVDGGLPLGTRVLAQEEQLAFDLLNSLNDEQRGTAIIADTAPREIRAAGEPQPPTDDAVGITFAELDQDQKQIMRRLVMSYANNLPAEIAEARVEAIRKSGPEKVHFAWSGPTKPGVGHYYRIQGPTFLIEFVNTQPDPAGNPANHIHCVWRDMQGDFAITLAE